MRNFIKLLKTNTDLAVSRKFNYQQGIVKEIEDLPTLTAIHLLTGINSTAKLSPARKASPT